MPFRVFKWLFLAYRFWCFKHHVVTEGGQRLGEGQRSNAVRSKPPGGPQVELAFAAGEGAGQGLQDLCCRQPCGGGCGPRRAGQRAPGACCPAAAPGSTRGGSRPPRPPSRPAEGRRCCGRLSRRRRPREGRGARARLSARLHPRRAPGLVPRLGGGPEPSGGSGGVGAGSAGRRAPAAAAAERGLRGARARCGARPRGAGWRAGAGAGPEAPPAPAAAPAGARCSPGHEGSGPALPLPPRPAAMPLARGPSALRAGRAEASQRLDAGSLPFTRAVENNCVLRCVFSPDFPELRGCCAHISPYKNREGATVPVWYPRAIYVGVCIGTDPCTRYDNDLCALWFVLVQIQAMLWFLTAGTQRWGYL